ncbi:hypothetical protein D0T84_14155 [Dysgonomonas sp. 521]|uniref:carboxypeptidase-like regulatory domain-containing protein n=1 Tax=Dysgonomonas sp. 521 TaxID=2302932 RepID=UPI0013CFF650|nr:carboxypeptidase-like regulatory domain-containing protein [Dysgonomonas sp. 521]NDV96047.1 hypothetical protein [Dysgonomonas sp. 521]
MTPSHITLRYIFLLSLLSLCFSTVTAQLINWPETTGETYVFEISNKEALKLLKSDPKDSLILKMLHSPKGSFIGNNWANEPEQGHFLHARIIKNKVNFNYKPVVPFHVYLFKEYGALTIQITDASGEIRDDAKIKLGGSRLEYDKNSRTYTTDDYWSEEPMRILTVELDKFMAVFDLRKHLVSPWYNSYNDRKGKSPDFYSYMITDKNKYKPKETVRFKSYALSGRKRPIKEPLEVWMSMPGRYEYKQITTLEPYHEGGFAGEVNLDDSLKLRLDDTYYIQLRDKKGRVVSSTGFRYEDYELYDSQLEVQLSQRVHYSPDTNRVAIKVTDANGLYLLDTRAEVVVTRGRVENSYTDMLTLPDVLLSQQIDLNNDSPTMLDIPAGLFKESDCNYSVSVRVTTFDNQVMEQRANAIFYYSKDEIVTETKNDSITFSYYKLGKEQKILAEIKYDDLVEAKIVELPYTEKFNQKRSYYTIKSIDSTLNKIIDNSSIPSRLDLTGGIEKDSFNVKLVNPLALEVSWFIYQGNILLEKGSGSEFDFKYPNTDLEVAHYVEIFYFMGNEEEAYRRVFVPKTEFLDIDVNLPDRVYPGQKIDATVTVKDNLGKPVSGVDLTAFSVNTLLGHDVPDLPYYGAPPRTREQRATFSMDERNYSFSMPLNYKFWNKLANLENVDYYKFTYPWYTLFRHTVDTPDGTTQFAPYVMKDGQAVEIYAIERNNLPLYFSWTDQPKSYSFPALDTVCQTISLRLPDRVIRLDSICFDAGKKTVLSLDIDRLPVNAKVIKINNGNSFTSEESNRYSNYISRLPVPEYSDYTYLERAGAVYPVFQSCLMPRRGSVLAGPIPYGTARYGDSVEYFHEGGFSYKFDTNVVYKYPEKVLPHYMSYNYSNKFYDLNDFMLNAREFRKRLEECQKGKGDWHPRNILVSEQGLNMNFRFPEEKEKSGVSNLLFENIISGKIVYPDMYDYGYRKYSQIAEGTYNVILLYNNGKYLKQDNVKFEKNTYLDLNMTKLTAYEADTVSLKWLSLRGGATVYKSTSDYRYYSMSETWYTRKKTFGNTVTGTVKDDTGEPLIGVSVQVVGTSYGAISDLDGNFSLEIDGEDAVLKFTYIGFKPKELKVTAKSQVSVTLEDDAAMLDEVVVVGYGVQKKSYLTASVSTVSYDTSSMSAPARPEMLDNFDDAEDSPGDDAEERLYSELMQLSGLRTNFSDVGFWEPRLYTDKKGKAEFTAIFPDNITKWDAVVYAMNRKLKTGTFRKSIKSYKPLMAELKTPQFLVVGDSSNFAGTIRNYTKDPQIQGKVTFKLQQDTLMQKHIDFGSSYSEKLYVTAADTDSITTQYVFTRNDGYSDGEQRSISVVPQGTELAKGTLSFLRDQDNIEVSAADNEKVQVRISGKQLDVYMDATYYLTGYKYACNEQLASKLIGLLNYRIYQQYTGEKFKHDKSVKEIINRLLKNRNDKQMWSWWGLSSNTSFWMSAHIMRALKMAKDAGYTVNMNFRKVETDYADIKPYRASSLYDIEVIHALSEWGAKQDYAKAVDILEKEVARCQAYDDSIVDSNRKKYKSDWYQKRSFLKEKLLLWEVRQKQNIGYEADSIAKYMKKAILGEVYCDDGRQDRYWYSDKLNNTLIAYRIVRNDSTLQELKEPMQMYILGTKASGWNTYQASSALATVFPDLLAGSYSKDKPATVILRGKENKEITQFPYETTLTRGETLSIQKKEGMPLIYTAYSYRLVTDEHTSEAFDVKSSLSKDRLTAGTPVSLSVTVNVKQEKAEHVMIEVPIPAGCSYASKNRGYYSGREVHREYFKEKVVIFCEDLPKGTYTYNIELLPRYTGRYTLNPAKVELMYFPVINANNDLRKVDITEKVK